MSSVFISCVCDAAAARCSSSAHVCVRDCDCDCARAISSRDFVCPRPRAAGCSSCVPSREPAAARCSSSSSAHVCVRASVTVRDQLYWIQNKHAPPRRPCPDCAWWWRLLSVPVCLCVCLSAYPSSHPSVCLSWPRRAPAPSGALLSLLVRFWSAVGFLLGFRTK